MRPALPGRAELAVTTIYVTHDQIEAMTMADVIVVMNGGIVQQIGAPLELYDRPSNRFVAGFIGSPAMNFFEGKVEGGAFVKSGGSLQFPLPATGSRANGAPIVYGARPEDFVIDDGGIEAVVKLVEPTGSELQVEAEMAGQSITALFRERHSIAPGDRVKLRPNPERSHLFDASDGLRLN